MYASIHGCNSNSESRRITMAKEKWDDTGAAFLIGSRLLEGGSFIPQDVVSNAPYADGTVVDLEKRA